MCKNDLQKLVGGSQPDPTPAPPAPPDYSGASRSAVNAGFSRFTPDYYTTRANNFTGNYNADVANQYKNANSELTAGLVQRGLDTSSLGKTFFNNLQGAETDALGRASGAADAYNGALKTKVSDAENGLYSQATANSDPTALGKQASSTAASLDNSNYTPLGDLFGSVIGSVAPSGAAPFTPFQPVAAGGGQQGASGVKLAGANTGGLAPTAKSKVVGG